MKIFFQVFVAVEKCENFQYGKLSNRSINGCVMKNYEKKNCTLLIKKCEEIQTRCVENSHKKLETSRKVKKKNTDLPDIT